ncbi:LysM peptidoglycan-binding domain-containing protein [Prochlorothrix hollandica]|uniref:LysM peptidoglycan-binding domain-containing protein n=1 Tax=Prochlorothrix hollandica TaxID=1223 RepID=UPI000346F4A5|nr:LysM peptidoglycan-binding domain-containing protein [Prochlorothrix hollandica]
MTIKITCPVCQHPNIEDNTCPNCETDLTLIRMLMELPSVPQILDSQISKEAALPLSPDRSHKRHWSNAFVFLLTGIILGILGSAAIGFYSSRNLISTRPTPMLTPPIANPISPSPVPSVMPLKLSESEQRIKTNTCDGFQYFVRPGDSLTLVAWKFYGDADRWVQIVEANPTISKQVNVLEIGDVLLIPNSEAICS